MVRFQAPPATQEISYSDVLRVSSSICSAPSFHLPQARNCEGRGGKSERRESGKEIGLWRSLPDSPRPAHITPSTTLLGLNEVDNHPVHMLAVMKNMGSLYTEMARQLISTDKWTSVVVRQSHNGVGELFSASGIPMRNERIALLLGEKIPVEKFIASRRVEVERRRRVSSKKVGSFVSSRQRDQLIFVNYVENMRCITLKGSMVSTLLMYYSQSWEQLGEYLPLTFCLMPRQPKRDEREWLLRTLRKRLNHGTLWIAKSSSGCHGDNIKIFRNDADGVKKMITYIDTQKKPHMWVVQVYIDRPLLYHRRKFDIRCWVLLRDDPCRIYVYEKLVMRLSSVEYETRSATLETAEGRLAHITNHCLQTQGEGFGTFEEGNELWSEDLDAVIRYKGKRMMEKGITHRGANPELQPSLKNTVIPQINHIVVETLLAAKELNPNRPSLLSTICFQVFGYDFLIDETFRVWLLEINGTPGVAERLLPGLVADTIEKVLTPAFPNTTKSSVQLPGITKKNRYVKVYP